MKRHCLSVMFFLLGAFSASAHYGVFTAAEYANAKETLANAKTKQGEFSGSDFRQGFWTHFVNDKQMMLVHLSSGDAVYFFSERDRSNYFESTGMQVDSAATFQYESIDPFKIDLTQLPPEHALKLWTYFAHDKTAQYLKSDDKDTKAIRKFLETANKKLGTYAAQGAEAGFGMPFVLSWMAGYEGLGTLAQKAGARDPGQMAGAFLGGMTTGVIGFAPSVALSPLTTLIGTLANLGVGVKDKVLKKKHEAKFKALVRDLFKQFMVVFGEIHRQIGDDDEKVLLALHEMLVHANAGYTDELDSALDYTSYFNSHVGVEQRNHANQLVTNLNFAARVLTLKKVLSSPEDLDKLARYFGVRYQTEDDAITFVTALYFLSKNEVLRDVFRNVTCCTLVPQSDASAHDDL